jgi:tRNA (guanine37-N1)-methyltransferase
MRIDVFTLFPGMFSAASGPLQESILKRAQDMGRLTVFIHNIRDYTSDRHHITDDAPYGGGGGMVMKPDPIFRAVESVLRGQGPVSPTPIILLSPQGRLFTQEVAQELAQHEAIALICGHYEGVDERVRAALATDEISIGDYVLTGGELAAMVIVDAVARLLPGVLGDPGAAANDSHATGLLEYPHYTRPPVFRDMAVPDILVSGNHAGVERWRRREALRRTWQRRPDMLLTAELTEADRNVLVDLAEETIDGLSELR